MSRQDQLPETHTGYWIVTYHQNVDLPDHDVTWLAWEREKWTYLQDRWVHTPIWYLGGHVDEWVNDINLGLTIGDPLYSIMPNYSDIPNNPCADCGAPIMFEDHYLCKDCR